MSAHVTITFPIKMPTKLHSKVEGNVKYERTSPEYDSV
jgi:hypothetical protein